MSELNELCWKEELASKDWLDWNSFKLEKKLFCDCCSRGVNKEDWFWLFWPKLKLLPTLARRSLVVVAVGVDVGVG